MATGPRLLGSGRPVLEQIAVSSFDRRHPKSARRTLISWYLDTTSLRVVDKETRRGCAGEKKPVYMNDTAKRDCDSVTST